MEYALYSRKAVMTTKIGLNLVRFEKYAEPIDPSPRDAKIRPPLQHKDAAIAVNTDPILSSFSFKDNSPYLYYLKKLIGSIRSYQFLLF